VATEVFEQRRIDADAIILDVGSGDFDGRFELPIFDAEAFGSQLGNDAVADPFANARELPKSGVGFILAG